LNTLSSEGYQQSFQSVARIFAPTIFGYLHLASCDASRGEYVVGLIVGIPCHRGKPPQKSFEVAVLIYAVPICVLSAIETYDITKDQTYIDVVAYLTLNAILC